MYKKVLTSLVLVGSMITLSSTQAHDALSAQLAGKFSGNFGFVSDYAFRGLTQTKENPALQGNIDFNFDNGIKLGTWGSNIEFGSGSKESMELDLYAGYAKTFGKVSTEGGVIYYAYPGAKSNLNFDYTELYGLIGYDFGFASLTASLNYSPEFFGESGEAFYPRLTAKVPLPANFALEGWIGRQYIEKERVYGVPDYNDWALGVGYTIDSFTIKAQYVDTSLSKQECASGCDARGIISISKAF